MNVGVSALVANQQALTVTGHNIANVSTPGYSRQTVATKAIQGQNTGSGFIGKGVQVATVMRHYSDLLGRQANAASAASSADAIRYQSLMQMQDIYSGGDGSLGAAINDMMNAFADVESAPADGTARNTVLTRMNELAARFRSASATLQELDYSTKQQLQNNVILVNDLARQVASLNGQIARSLASGHQPNDLLDARDQLVREINQYIQTSQVEADDGSISLFVGGSQALVLGASTGQLSVDETKEYPGSQKLSLYFSQPNGQEVELKPAMVAGGEIAGLLSFNNDDLVVGRNLLGRLALAIGSELNQQNRLGLTLSGNYGSDLFALTLQTYGTSNITGYDNALDGQRGSASVVDSQKLVASDYQLQFGPGNSATLIRLSDGQKTTIDNVNADIDLTVDGLKFEVPASIATNAQVGQSILFQPFSIAADEIQALVFNPNDLAVSSALSASISTTNTGTLQLSSVQARDLGKLATTVGGVDTTVYTQVPAKDAPATIRFTDDAGSYEVSYRIWNDTSKSWEQQTASGTYTSGQPISVAGWSITMTGTPKQGDTVSVGNALDLDEGFKLNAGNASAFLGLRDAKIFDGGTALGDGFSSAMAVIGTRTQSAQYAAQLSETVAANLDADRTAVSGVNLDEEAARLLQYQQAYQASAKIIQTAQSLFDSLLNTMR